MASTPSAAILLLIVSCILVVCSAHKARHPPSPSSSPASSPQGPKKIVVGGSEHWNYGFNYSDWATKNGPFHVKDTLVFKYDPPTTITFPHSVYLLANLASFSSCNFNGSQKVANWTQGGGDGFEFVLEQSKTYYFACGERFGLHCTGGNMKFSVLPKA